jgi:hypothetical protein
VSATAAALAAPIEAVQAVVAAAQDAVTKAVPAGPGAPAPAAAAPDAGPSRAELYRVAQELDIPGRSKMTKDELAAAVQRARS